MVKDFLSYIFKAKNQHSLHSPFAYHFYTKLFKGNNKPNSEIESLRKVLLKDKTLLHINDFGAGSRISKKNQRSIASIANSAKKDKKWALLMANLIADKGYTNIIELGTSFGLTTAYLATANKAAKVSSFEGCTETGQVALKNWKSLGINNIELIEGNIDVTLPSHLKTINRVDLAFFDANHRYEPTISYYEQCLSKADQNSCFVFDDIYWSAGMKKAWQELVARPEVTLSLDFFYIGVLFFDPKLSKEHFVLK